MAKSKSATNKKSKGKRGEIILRDLLILKLQALCDVEGEIIDALPRMAEEATETDLKTAFERHLLQTRGHEKRLERAFELLGITSETLKVDAIRGLIKDSQWLIKNVKNGAALDASLIAAAQTVEHYEIASYGTALEWARLIGEDEVADLLSEKLEEETTTNEELNDLATAKVNEAAMEGDANENDPSESDADSDADRESSEKDI